MFFRIIRFIISLFLIPVCFFITISFYKGFLVIRGVSETGQIFILGAFSYCVVHLIFFKLDYLYILAHELLHSIATLFSGGKVLGIKVSSKGGSVKTTTPNLIVMLAPYLVPLYTVLFGAIYYSLSFFIDVAKYNSLLIFLIGFSLMLHVTYTAGAIKDRQSDLIKVGYLFSITFIYIVNLVIVFGIISWLFHEVDFNDFISRTLESSKEFYSDIFRRLYYIVNI